MKKPVLVSVMDTTTKKPLTRLLTLAALALWLWSTDKRNQNLNQSKP